MSQSMQEFISANSGGTFSVSGVDADLFRVDPQTGKLTTKTFVDFENPSDADANNNYAVSVTYTSDTNSFTDNVSLEASPIPLLMMW